MILRAVIAALVAALAVTGWFWVEARTWEGRALRSQADARTARTMAASCEARLTSIQKDKESDDAIDRLPDGDLRHVPDHWLRP